MGGLLSCFVPVMDGLLVETGFGVMVCQEFRLICSRVRELCG